MPCRCLNPAIIERGAAEPPTSIPFIRERSHLPGIRVEQCEDAEPDRRHAGRPRHALLDEVVEQRLGVEVRARIHELRAEHRGDVRVAPRVRVEHRDDGQDHVLLRDAERERIACCDAERVEDGRAVRVDDAFRHPGGPARVTHRGGCVLVELGVAPVVGARACEQLLVRVLHEEDVLDVGVVLERVDQRCERAVRDQDAVAGVLGDVADVAVVQPQVQRVEDEAAARDPEVRLHVLVVVPAERRNAISRLEPEIGQRHCELFRAARHVRIRVAVEALVGQPRDDLFVAEEPFRALQQVRKRQLEVHHQAVHGSSFVGEVDETLERPSTGFQASLSTNRTSLLRP